MDTTGCGGFTCIFRHTTLMKNDIRKTTSLFRPRYSDRCSSDVVIYRAIREERQRESLRDGPKPEDTSKDCGSRVKTG